MARHKVLLTPYVTEKSLDGMTKLNRLDFLVERTANKKEIKEAFEKRYAVKVEKVMTKTTQQGKHALIKLAKGYSAEDVGMRIGVF